MLTRYLVDVKNLSVDEKKALYQNLDREAFMVNHYLGHDYTNGYVGLVVYWDISPERFKQIVMVQPKCKYLDVTGWDISNDYMQAFAVAFNGN